MHSNPYTPRASTAAPGVSPCHSDDQQVSSFSSADNSQALAETTAKTKPESNAGSVETRSLRTVAATNLRRGRRHLRPVRNCGPTAQLDLFTAGCTEHGTPTGNRCALCLDQLDLFGPGGDAA